ncbi:hypothetical protein GOP47_0003713 [Adiantum capillus-veneris]|uniref:Uncharacterized protein n=1 Tax=Adiantum capillus-veneris TaxID=13818 RepID=A0A9D4ZPN7_ADICA|nr:hypothetical protein GOP47_0003713 [Adiantum capillus-veneris]
MERHGTGFFQSPYPLFPARSHTRAQPGSITEKYKETSSPLVTKWIGDLSSIGKLLEVEGAKQAAGT